MITGVVLVKLAFLIDTCSSIQVMVSLIYFHFRIVYPLGKQLVPQKRGQKHSQKNL